MRMSKQEENKLLPGLRFPEFQEQWDKVQLGKLGEFTGGGTPSKNNESYWKGNIPWVSSSDIYEESIHEVNINRFITEEALRNSATKRVPENSILLVSRVGVGKLAITKGSVCTSQDFMNFTPTKDNLLFLSYFLKTKGEALLGCSQGMAIKGFTKEDISRLDIAFPSLEEQQKIADCLTSIDELITAQAKKFETLKAHKKGLVQKLFPAEGETVPKLRFLEFRGSKDWVESSLGACLSSKPEYGINAPAVPFSEELPTYLRITDISESGNYIKSKKVSVAKEVTEKNYLQDGDIVLARTGASVGKAYKYRNADGNLVFAGFLIRVRPNIEKLNSELLFQFLSTDQYWFWVNFSSARSGQPGINGAEYASLPIPLPPTMSEQKKVADCLASVDKLIAGQAKKINAIKAHKKGLMQQLFPVMDKVAI